MFYQRLCKEMKRMKKDKSKPAPKLVSVALVCHGCYATGADCVQRVYIWELFVVTDTRVNCKSANINYCYVTLLINFKVLAICCHHLIYTLLSYFRFATIPSRLPLPLDLSVFYFTRVVNFIKAGKTFPMLTLILSFAVNRFLIGQE